MWRHKTLCHSTPPFSEINSCSIQWLKIPQKSHFLIKIWNFLLQFWNQNLEFGVKILSRNGKRKGVKSYAQLNPTCMSMLFCPKILIFTSNILIELNRLPSVFYGVCLKVVCFPMQNCHLVDLAVSHWDRGSIWIRVNLPSWHVRPPYEWKTAAKQRCSSHATTLREDFFLPAHQSIVSDSDPSPTREIWLWRACTFVSSPTKENLNPKIDCLKLLKTKISLKNLIVSKFHAGEEGVSKY